MSNDDLVAARLDWLRTTFFEGTSAPDALTVFRDVAKGPRGADALSRLLRNHREDPIEDPEEVEARDAFDYLLGYYSVREVAVLSAYAPVLPKDATLAGAASILGHPSVRVYYEEHYPLLLPKLFRERLEERWSTTLEPRAAADGLVEEFLTMVESGFHDDELQTFLWYLDDGWVGESSLADVVGATMKQPERLVQALTSPRRARTPGDAGVIGLSRFLARCAQQDALLDGGRADPIVKAALWHHQGYWYINMRDKVLDVVEAAGQAIDAWQSDVAPSERVRFSDRIRDMMDPARGRALEETFAAARR